MAIPIQKVSMKLRGAGGAKREPAHGRGDVELAGCLLTAEAIRGDRVAEVNAVANLSILELTRRIQAINAQRRRDVLLAHKKCREAKRQARAKYPGAAGAAAIGKSGGRGKRGVAATQIPAPMPADGASDPNGDRWGM